MMTLTRLLSLICVLLVLSSLPTEGSTYQVDRLTDANPSGGGVGSGLIGDLRYTLTHAQSGDTITFRVTGTIQQTFIMPTITRNISILGPGVNKLTVLGGGLGVASGATVVISGLSITQGFGNGGGIGNRGTLTLNGVTISGCRAQPGGVGGGIWNMPGGTLTLNNSTVSGNIADHDQYGGGIGAGIYDNGTLTLNNSTVSGNHGYNVGGVAGNVVTLNNSTISGNIGGDLAGSSITARNTIIGSYSGALTSLGHNLIGNTGGHTNGYDATDLLNVNPLLGPLQNNGGPTQTIAPLPGSPAIDTGDNANAPPFDQRGPGFPRISGGLIDIGAVEVQSPTPLPDLSWTGDGISGPTSITTGTTFTLSRTYTISTSFPRSTFTIGYYRSPNPTFGAGAVRLGTETINAATDRTVGTHAGTSPPLQIGAPGTYYLLARLDDNNALAESNPTNNLAQAPQPVQVFTGGLSINNVSVTLSDQGSISVSFTVSLSAASNQTVTVHYATADGTATAGSDYMASSGTLTFAPGQTSQTLTVTILNDPTNQADEMFSVNLNNAVNAAITQGQGICTIHAGGGGGDGGGGG